MYLHGNSGNRLDALSCFNMIALYKLSLCCFDFSGCGRSEGKYISLGWHEKEDIKVVIEYLRQWEGFSSFILWGRSMGAVAALLYVNYYYEEAKEVVNGIILDSPFCSLKRVAEEVFQQFHGSTILNPLFHVSFSSLNKIVKKKASFDIKDLEISNNLLELDIPCLFVHGSEDKFVVPQHSQILFDCYKGRKKYVLVKGDHNSSRGVDFWEDVSYFMYESLKDKSLRKPFSIFGPKEHAIGASKFYCQYRKMKRDLAKKQDEREPFDNGDLTKKPVHVVVVIDSKEVRSIEPFLGITNWVFPLESIKGVIVEDAFGIVFEEETYLLITPEPEKIRESILINKSIHKKEKFKHQDDILIIVDNLTRKMFSSSINNKTEINIPELTRSVISTLEPFIFGTELTNEQLEIEVKNLIYKLMEDSL
uniref:Serine aminopeptidase S33 domain-containing protein n=1 Tax=Arcella intermedia TaxID=1963864 RepID=A0A6B2L4N3_9EUKA